MIRIAFLAIAQAHQFLHWIPAALRLAREPGVEVTVLGASKAGLDFVRSYDADGLLQIRKLWAPSIRRDSLFTPPERSLTLLLNYNVIRRFPFIVTTEATSSLLHELPGFRSKMILIKHGAGDREGSYNPKHSRFDLNLVAGPKHKAELIQRGLATADKIAVTGYAKFELVRPAGGDAGGQPLALYNPHFDKSLSSWFGHGPALVRAMGHIEDWRFVIAPHVKLAGGPRLTSLPENVVVDRGSVRSIDMSYTDAADVYIGDVSSQVYEFLRRPRPCIFLNFEQIAWEGDGNYAHWRLGEVISTIEELAPALRRATAMHARFEPLQFAAVSRSIDEDIEPASERQARVILDFAKRSLAAAG